MNDSICKYCEYGDEICNKVYKCNYPEYLKLIDEVTECNNFVRFSEVENNE